MTTNNLSELNQLKKFTTIVADTGDFESIKNYQPQDATTNPTLIFKASQKPEYKHLLLKAISSLKSSPLSGQKLSDAIIDELLILFGSEILKIVPGRVSTEVDARLSFDTQGSIQKALLIIEKYKNAGIPKERILIKLASTWEGIQAALYLQQQGINCNMTLLFALPQAIACAEAGAKLISPFVGRIYDWYKAAHNKDYQGADDPGVQSVQSIYNYYKKFDYKTEIMGASFRNKSQITELAGCDLLTISPELLNELSNSFSTLSQKLSPSSAKSQNITKLPIDEKSFRYLLNDNPMASDKLSQGIRSFAQDTIKLEALISQNL